MVLIMDDTAVTTREQVQQVLSGPQGITFKGVGREQRYAWIESVLERFEYFEHNRKGKGWLLRYLRLISGISRAQVTRLVAQFLREGAISPSKSRRHRFSRTYTDTDKELLAQTDNAHGRLSGPATRKILQRQYFIYGWRVRVCYP